MLNKILSSKVVRSGVAFQLVWFVLILAPLPVAVLAVLGYLVFHAHFICNDRLLWVFSIRIFFVGLALDSFFFYSGILISSSGSLVIPLWLVGLWLCFSLAIPFGFGFLKKHYLLCAAFGFIGAPISYFSGAALRGDISFASPTLLSLLYIGVSWAVLLCYGFFILNKMRTSSGVVQAT